MKEVAKISCRALLVFILSCLTKPVPGLAQSTSVAIDGSSQYQRVDGFGIAHAFGGAKDLESVCPAGCNEQKQILDLLFSPTTGAGLNIFRIMAPSESHTIEPTSPGRPDLTPTYVWDHDSQGQVWMAKQAQSRGVRQFYVNAWSAPGFMKTNNNESQGGTLCGAPGTSCLYDWRQAYANYLVQYLRFYQSEGINITHLGPFNEPNFTKISFSSQMFMNTTQTTNFMEILRPAAVAAGFSPQIVCCESSNWGNVQDYLNAINSDASASPQVNVISGHAYGDNQGITFPLAGPTFNRNIWMTEWGLLDKDIPWDPNWDSPTKGAGLFVAYAIQKGLIDANLSAYFYWTAAVIGSNCFQNDCNYNLIQDLNGAVTPAKRLWAMAQFSRYIQPGATRILSSSQEANLLVSAFHNPDGTIAVVALNMEKFPIFTSFSLQNVGSAVNGTAAPFLTDSYNNVSPQDGILVQNGQFSTRVAPRALVTYVITPGNVLPAGQFIDQASNMCLGVPGGSTSPVQLVQWYCNGSADQNWIRDPNNAIISGGLTYSHWIDQNSGDCIAVAGGSMAAGAAVVQWPCYPGADQFWAKVPVGGGYTQLVNFSSGQCLGVSGGSLSAGSRIVQWPCYGPADQHWHYTAPHNLSVSFVDDGNGMVSSSSPPGLSCPNFCFAPMNDQTTVTLTATANPGSAFYGWSGACSGSQTTCTLIMNDDQNITAAFGWEVPYAGLPMHSLGIVDVTGSEQTYSYLIQQWCYDPDGYPYDCSYYDTAYDTGTLYLTIGGYTTSISYGPGSDAHNIAYWLAYQLNADPMSPVDAAPIDYNSSVHTLYLTSRVTGEAANYPVTTNVVSDGGNVNPPSFGFSPSALNLSGGH